jgi:CRP-like cAMP-binding protein
MILNDAAIQALFVKKGKTFPPGSVIFLEEEKGTDMFIIVSGEVEIFKSYREEEIFGGARLTLGTISENLCMLGAGDFFGEMALWNEEPRCASARARTQVEVIVLTKEDIEALVLRSPPIAVQMLKSVCVRLRDACKTPRLETVLPQIQEFIHSLQQDRRTAQRKAEKPAAPVPAPVGSSDAGEAARSEREPRTAARAGDSPAQAVDRSSAHGARKCRSCGVLAGGDDRFCRQCGKPLAAPVSS